MRKRVHGAHAGHHGGAWKVAYADFVTAMMAFFLLIWLLGPTTENQRRGIVDYFAGRVPISRQSAGGHGVLEGGFMPRTPESRSRLGDRARDDVALAAGAPRSDEADAATRRALQHDDRIERQRLETIQSEILRSLEASAALRNLAGNLRFEIKAIAEAKTTSSGIEAITEAVRRKLSLQITHGLVAPDGTLPLIQLGPEWEGLFRQHEVREGNGVTDVALPPSEIRRLATGVGAKLHEASAWGQYPAIAVPGNRRRLVRLLLDAGGVKSPMLAFEEIGTRHRPAFVGVA